MAGCACAAAECRIDCLHDPKGTRYNLDGLDVYTHEYCEVEIIVKAYTEIWLPKSSTMKGPRKNNERPTCWEAIGSIGIVGEEETIGKHWKTERDSEEAGKPSEI